MERIPALAGWGCFSLGVGGALAQREAGGGPRQRLPGILGAAGDGACTRAHSRSFQGAAGFGELCPLAQEWRGRRGWDSKGTSSGGHRALPRQRRGCVHPRPGFSSPQAACLPGQPQRAKPCWTAGSGSQPASPPPPPWAALRSLVLAQGSGGVGRGVGSTVGPSWTSSEPFPAAGRPPPAPMPVWAPSVSGPPDPRCQATGQGPGPAEGRRTASQPTRRPAGWGRRLWSPGRARADPHPRCAVGFIGGRGARRAGRLSLRI